MGQIGYGLLILAMNLVLGITIVVPIVVVIVELCKLSGEVDSYNQQVAEEDAAIAKVDRVVRT